MFLLKFVFDDLVCGLLGIFLFCVDSLAPVEKQVVELALDCVIFVLQDQRVEVNQLFNQQILLFVDFSSILAFLKLLKGHLNSPFFLECFLLFFVKLFRVFFVSSELPLQAFHTLYELCLFLVQLSGLVDPFAYAVFKFLIE